jgi:hypothetical protein
VLRCVVGRCCAGKAYNSATAFERVTTKVGYRKILNSAYINFEGELGQHHPIRGTNRSTECYEHPWQGLLRELHTYHCKII